MDPAGKVVWPQIVKECKPCVDMRLLKIFVGGWSITVKMHEQIVHGCLYGCIESNDEVDHSLTSM